jgi:hypothetical protein
MFDEWLRELWSLVEIPSTQRARTLASEVEARPEANVDDSHRPDYYAMRALSVLAYAIDVLIDEDPLKPALWCSFAIIEVLSDIDYLLHLDPSSTSSLASTEMREEERTIAQLIEENGQVTIGECRSSDVFTNLRARTDAVARARGWQSSAS